jgi:hypothetical protein
MPLFHIETTVHNPKQLECVRDGIFDAAISVGATLVESRNTAARDRLFLVFEYDDEAFLRTTILLVDSSAEFAEVRRSGDGTFSTEWDFPDRFSIDSYAKNDERPDVVLLSEALSNKSDIGEQTL